MKSPLSYLPSYLLGKGCDPGQISTAGAGNGNNGGVNADIEMGMKIAALSPSLAAGIPVESAYGALVHDRSILRSVGRIIFSAVYFSFFTAVLFTHIPTALMYEQSYAISSVLAQSGSDTITPDSPMKFYNIGQLSDVLDYITKTLVPNIFVTQDQNGVDIPREDWARIALFNKALGGVLIEVYRKSTTECPADGSLLKLYPTCHEYQGLDSEYNSYLLDFGVDANETSASLAEWKTKNWIDASTGEVQLSVVTYNGELEGYVVSKLTLEFHLGGFITPKASFTPTISIPYGKRSSYANDIIVWILLAAALFMSIRRWRVSPKSSSCRQAITRIIALFMVEAATGVFYAIWAKIVSLLNNSDFQDSLWSLDDSTSSGSGSTDNASTKKGLNTAINTLWDIAYYTAALRVVGAVVIALIGLQILERFHFHPQLNILTRTVANALRQFRSFFIVFFVIFSSFTIIGCMIFGDRAEEFSSLDNAMASCINMLFNAFDFDSIKDLRFSVAFYWIYMIVVSLVLMNMMLAIVLDAYEQVSSDSYKLEASVSLTSRIQTICWDLLFEVQFVGPDQDIVVSRGKIRSSLLERVLKEKMKSSSIQSLTPCTLRSLFPTANITDEEIIATLLFIEHGVTVKTVLTANETQSNEE